MPDLARSNGKLIRKSGTLARGIECCCGPPPCPNCCIEIDWGTFNGDGDLFDPGVSGVEFILVMPTKNSRIVCDGETVEMVIDILDTEMPPSGTAYISWDRHWKYVSHTPAVGTDGLVFEGGLVEWGTVTPTPTLYKVVLEFDKCWADNDSQYGDIEAGFRTGDFVLVTGINCLSSACCEPDFPCDDCCWFVEPFDNTALSYELDDGGNPVFWAVNNAGDKMKIKLEGTDNGVICIDQDLTIRMTMIPAEYNGDAWAPEPSVVALSGWKWVSHTPGLGNGSKVDGPDPPMSIVWGDDVEAFEFVAIIQFPCPEVPDQLTVGFETGYLGGSGASVDIFFSCCSDHDIAFSCDDCYPAPDTGWMHCRIDISGSNTAVPTDIVLADHPGAATNPANLVDWTCFAIWENYCCVDGSPTTSGTRFLDVIFRCCAYGRSCSQPDAELALEDWVDDIFGAPYVVTDCSLQTPPDATIAAIIASTLGIAGGGGDDGYQIVYKEDAAADCDECPPPP